ncbi:hypothetical protein CC1G_13668 [Coprinopsis cinerea okayama7|uniref:Uncharacterized protein n=1 Tax=Coprinopsis cinerea (strain Okayama-7 / 130 / ATCC MYA-4618 / FGSC 9003) TaxID=240176 RepID=D6RJT5_COPC7|nr:hypothetical protein CC1G_13668 [Coprinopsis cinerea okayama7\|eukprot:XP_002912136.1 hypothetical protein CC1G_13668 [Coprinopsis cinerea okayama7\
MNHDINQRTAEAIRELEQKSGQMLERDEVPLHLSVILGFLDGIERAVSSRELLSKQTMAVFLLLARPGSLWSLFKQRQASRGKQFVVVQTVEGILFRLLTVNNILTMQCSGELLDEKLPSTLRAQQYTALRNAIRQLPDSWNSLPSILSKTAHFPIIQRCALHLLFIAYCLGEEDDIPTDTGNKILEHLYRCIENSQQGPCLLARDSNMAHKSVIASVFLCLFSKIHRACSGASGAVPPPSFRPRSLSFLLELVGIVIGSRKEAHCMPLLTLNGPQRLLVLFDDFVPWCWTVWNDARAANSEQVIALTATWFFHLSKSREHMAQEQALESHIRTGLLANVAASKLMLSHLFSSLVQEFVVTPEDGGPSHLLEVLLMGTCSLRAILQLSGSDQDSIMLQCIDSILYVYSHLGHGYQELEAKEVIMEVLTLTDPTILATCFLRLLTSPRRGSYLDNLDRAIIHCRSSLGSMETGGWRAAKLTLDFMAIMWHSSGKFILLFSGLSLLGTVVQVLGEENHKTLPGYCELRNTVLIAISIVRDEDGFLAFVTKPQLYELSSSVASGGICLTTASIYAHYLLTKKVPTKSRLLVTLAWNYFQTSLSVILAGTFTYTGEAETIALLASSSICFALVKLLHSSPELKDYVFPTPWTVSLYGSLSKLLEYEKRTTTDFLMRLRERLRHPGEALLKALSPGSSGGSSTFRDEFPSFSTRLLFFRTESGKGRFIASVDSVQ